MVAHQPVLLDEAINGLAIIPNGIYIDGTFGRGGHSRAILQQLNDQGRLIVVDKDLEAICWAQEYFATDPRVIVVHGSFADLHNIVKDQESYGLINGILLDLGVSSPQLDNPERGFSFMQDGPLDMRMDVTQTLDAASFVNQSSQDEMIHVFREYGEERFAGRIARAIVDARSESLLQTTAQLAAIVKAAHPKWEKHKHPATRVFQAIRIYINQELMDLTTCLAHAVDVLAPHGRLVVISFHSLEDRIVKRFMRDQEQGDELPLELPIRMIEKHCCFKRVGKAIKPQEEEIKKNVRARSAVLRIGEKIA